MFDLPTAISLVRDAFKSKNQRKMRKVNDKIMIATALEFTPEMHQLAVYSYVLSKILSKPRLMSRRYSDMHHETLEILDKLSAQAEKQDKKAFTASLRELKVALQNVERADSRYIKSMIDKGRLKTAAILYAQGISLSAAAEMTGVEKQEIMDYAGKTMMFDRVEEKTPLSKRIKKARKILLGGKE